MRHTEPDGRGTEPAALRPERRPEGEPGERHDDLTATMLHLQQTAGNASVSRLVESGWPGTLGGSLERAFRLPLGATPLVVDPGLSAAAAAGGFGVKVHPHWYDPDSVAGQHLIAHEVAHLAGGQRTGERDADESAGRFVRGESVSGDRQPSEAGAARSDAGAAGHQTAGTAGAVRYKTAVEAAKDAIKLAAQGMGTDEKAIMGALRALTPDQVAELSTDTAILQIFRDEFDSAELKAVGTALERGRVGTMSRADVAKVLANPAGQSFGALAAANTREELLAHQEKHAATGQGTTQGNHGLGPPPAGVKAADCTTYVLDVLGRTFAAKGQSATWASVMAKARAAGGGLKGTEVLEALQSEAGWEGVFWSPDPRNPADGKSEHPVAAKKVRETGKYYGVDAPESVINYRRTDPAAQTDLSGIELVRKLQFGVIAARGGTHMALIVNGGVYEVHWDLPSTSADVLTATPLESFAWLSGVLVAPKDDLKLARLTP
ncbi:hypothetical protein Acsp02_73700 [Actinoplanes sp. NBRC 103695]|nr:hypothetical protein Acsp02_73700 [Actinoplanes sp. NBRC 103695]